MAEPPSKKPRMDADVDPMEAFQLEGDFEICVEGEIVRVHSALLGLTSPVFAAMLRSCMQEGRSRRMELPGKSKEDLELFMSFLHPLQRAHIDESNVYKMLPWFDEYQITPLKDECEALLLRLPVTTDLLLQAHRFHLQKLYNTCLEEFTPRLFLDSFEKLALCPEVLRALVPRLQSKHGELKAFFDIFESLLCNEAKMTANVLPLLSMCLKSHLHLGRLPVEVRTQLPDLIADSPTTAAGTTLLLSALLAQATQIGRIRDSVVKLAGDIYNFIPGGLAARVHVRNMVTEFASTL